MMGPFPSPLTLYRVIICEGTGYRLTFYFFLFIYFLEREEGREKERERNINVWSPLIHPLLETWPATQARALRIKLAMLCLPVGAQSTESHQPGYDLLKIAILTGDISL